MSEIASILKASILKASILKVLYAYVIYSTRVGRSTITDFQKKCFPNKKRKTIANQIKQYENDIFFGPRLFVLQNVSVTMVPFKGMPALEALEMDKKDYSVYHSMALVGCYSLISFSRNKNSDSANILTYAVSIVPAYPSEAKTSDIDLTAYAQEKLPVMPKPLNWDDLDWGIYHKMNNPNQPSNVAAKALGLSHTSILERVNEKYLINLGNQISGISSF